jgi:hypothetical protein
MWRGLLAVFSVGWVVEHVWNVHVILKGAACRQMLQEPCERHFGVEAKFYRFFSGAGFKKFAGGFGELMEDGWGGILGKTGESHCRHPVWCTVICRLRPGP